MIVISVLLVHKVSDILSNQIYSGRFLRDNGFIHVTTGMTEHSVAFFASGNAFFNPITVVRVFQS